MINSCLRGKKRLFSCFVLNPGKTWIYISFVCLFLYIDFFFFLPVFSSLLFSKHLNAAASSFLFIWISQTWCCYYYTLILWNQYPHLCCFYAYLNKFWMEFLVLLLNAIDNIFFFSYNQDIISCLLWLNNSYLILIFIQFDMAQN